MIRPTHRRPRPLVAAAALAAALLLPATWAAADDAPPPSTIKPVPGLPDQPPAETSKPDAPKPDAAKPPAPAEAPAPATTDLLSKFAFNSDAAGITFRPPAGMIESLKPAPDEIASYTEPNTHATLRVTRASFPTPIPLTNQTAGDKTVQGLLEYTVNQLRQATPSAEVLRNDTVNVGSNSVGMIVLRYTLNGQTWLRQQAMFQVNEQLYYVFNYTAPSGGDEAGQKRSAEAFGEMLDSVRLLDRAKIKGDQDARLIRTRNLFLYWTEKRFNELMFPDKRYFRLVRAGKDVGYKLVEEMPNDAKLSGSGVPGVIAYERTHVVESDDQRRPRVADAASFQYMSYDRHHERWSRTVVWQTKTDQGPLETHATEFGESSQSLKRKFSKDAGVQQPEEKDDSTAPLSRPVTVHSLSVTVTGKDGNAEPVNKDLPPFYLPQAAWHFLPRLASEKTFLNEPRTYMFATYVNDKRELMTLYVDVLPEHEVFFDGKKLTAVTVTERLGLQGAPTVHYLTAAGEYLGSENREQAMLMLPTTEQEVLKLWPGANLTRPQRLEAPKAGAAAAGPTSGDAAAAPARGLPPAIR